MKIEIPVEVSEGTKLCLSIASAECDIKGENFNMMLSANGAGFIANYKKKSYRINTKDIAQSLATYLEEQEL